MDSKISDELWSEIRLEFGTHSLRFKEYEKAKANYQLSLELQDDKLDSLYRLASILAREGRINEALKNLQEKSTLGEF